MEGDERGGDRNQSIVRIYKMSKICLMCIWGGGRFGRKMSKKRVKCDANLICVIFLQESKINNQESQSEGETHITETGCSILKDTGVGFKTLRKIRKHVELCHSGEEPEETHWLHAM